VVRVKRFVSLVRRCVEDYEMIREGDVIAVGMSGGKDSVALLTALNQLRHYYPERFELRAISVDLGFGMDYGPLVQYCEGLGVPFFRVETEISQIVFEARQEENPCSLCAKMRKGALIGEALDRGCNKIALGHHRDDAVETMLMSLVFEGRISCFQPVTYMDRRGITQIRPMLYTGEQMARSVVEKYGLPVVKNKCPADGVSKRQEIKELVKELDGRYPGIRDRIFGGMQRLPLKGWAPKPYVRRRNSGEKIYGED